MAVAHFVGQIVFWFPKHIARTDTIRDLNIYYSTAHRAANHSFIYEHIPNFNAHYLQIRTFLYPPQFAAILLPISTLSFYWFSVIWYTGILIAFWMYAYFLSKLFMPRVTYYSVLIWGLVIGITPSTYYALSVGQVQPFLWAIFAYSLLSNRWRGIALGIMVQVKLYAVFTLFVGMVRERNKLTIPALITISLGIILGLAVFGPSSFRTWAAVVEPIAREGTFSEDNLSLSMGVLRLARVCGWSHATGHLPFIAILWLKFAGFAGPLLTWRICRHMPIQKLYAWLMTSTMLFAPICWNHYLIGSYVLVALYLRDIDLRTTDSINQLEAIHH